MNATPTNALLVGSTTARSATLQKWLRERDCHEQFAASYQAACRLMSQTEFDLVICQYDLPDRTAFPLLDWLEGSRSTLLFAAGAGKDSRWLPVIERGKRCYDRPFFRTRDLPDALRDLADGPVGGDALGTAVTEEALEPVGTK